MKRYPICPVAKPRMTRQDKWPTRPPKYKGKEWPRPSVKKYRNFENQVITHKVELPESGSQVIFVLPMPKSWNDLKKKDYFDTPHRQRPDLSNLIKALEDAVYSDDCKIWNYKGLTKIWGYKGEIIIK